MEIFYTVLKPFYIIVKEYGEEQELKLEEPTEINLEKSLSVEENDGSWLTWEYNEVGLESQFTELNQEVLGILVEAEFLSRKEI